MPAELSCEGHFSRTLTIEKLISQPARQETVHVMGEDQNGTKAHAACTTSVRSNPLRKRGRAQASSVTQLEQYYLPRRGARRGTIQSPNTSRDTHHHAGIPARGTRRTNARQYRRLPSHNPSRVSLKILCHRGAASVFTDHRGDRHRAAARARGSLHAVALANATPVQLTE